MIRSTLVRAALALALVTTVPAATAAQVDDSATPEGVDWHLANVGTDGVPWYADATLLLSSGEATGSTGCNRFGGSYTLAGEGLAFDSIAATERGCPEGLGEVEEAFLAALPLVATWSVEDEALIMADAAGNPQLRFEQPVVALTSSDVANLAALLEAHGSADERLQAAIDRLAERVDDMRIGVLRDRIKALEAAATKSAGPDLSAFTAAEKVLLGAVRKDIAQTCEPRRSQNPAGTIAALQCEPDAPQVADMAYYLMESNDAEKVYQQRMRAYQVKEGTQDRSCANGRPSQMWWVGGGFEVAGCYRNEDGRANLRFVNTLAQCRQLTAGDRQVKNPSIYIAVLGPDRDIGSLWGWAASSRDWEAGEDLFDPIVQPGQPWSDQCPHD